MKQQPRVRATGVLIEDGSILLTEQRVSAERGWSLPGGTLEWGESLAECLVREFAEETGLRIRAGRLLYVCDRLSTGAHVLHITFLVQRTGGALRVGREPERDAAPIRSVRWVPLDALPEHDFSARFLSLARDGFPGSGAYMGSISEIGL